MICKVTPRTYYRVAGIRYKTKEGTFFTENQNDVWNSKDEIMSWDFLFEAVLSSKFDDSVSPAGMEGQAMIEQTALEKFYKFEGNEEPDPLERLRFFCSLAMKGQDWLDVEQFFDDVKTMMPNT